MQIISNFGYVLNSMTTATISGIIDVLSKSVAGKIKNNKKSSHIFIEVNPKYNEDIFNFRLDYEMRMSVVDILYTLFLTIINFVCYKISVSKSTVN